VSELGLRLTSRQWATVDATMDNAAHHARETGGDEDAALAIRRAGWDQVPWVGPARDWPPESDVLTIRLRREQWKLAVGQLQKDHPVYEELGDQESLHLGRDAEQAIRAQLQ
jgi:hypothetical protein